MPGKRCVVGGCDNTYKEGVSIHKFPTASKYRRLWVTAVKNTRKDWDDPRSEANEAAYVCGAHFTAEAFEVPFKFADKFGMETPKKKRLKPEAVPTIFGQSKLTGAPTSGRCAVAKLERKRILQDVLGGPHETTGELQPTTPKIPKLKDTDERTAANILHDVLREPDQATEKIQPTPKIPDTDTDGSAAENMDVAVDVAIQCTLAPLPPLQLWRPTDGDDTDLDPEYEPSDEEDSDSDSDSQDSCRRDNQQYEGRDRFFLVKESNLMELFRTCRSCGGKIEANISRYRGTFIRITEACHDCGGSYNWDSQSFRSGIPEGNLQLSAGILFSGAKPHQTLRVFDILQCPTHNARSFMRHQRQWLQPAINYVWENHQAAMFKGLREIGVGLNVGGDGRSDSPGHSAKYGSYTFLDLDWNMVLHQELVQSNEVTSSNAMELEGLTRGLQFLEDNQLRVESLVTDRHRSVAKYLREQHGDIRHFYDVWHVAKGVTKKLQQVAKKKSCSDISPWTKSISNHLYWTAASTPEGRGDELLAKWNSVGNHIQNIHHHESELFPKCLHSEENYTGKQKKWLKPHTEACESVLDVIGKNYLQRDIRMLSPTNQIANVEGFHSVIIHFAPKMTHFSYNGMKSRLQLAALHYNENSNRLQAMTKEGLQRFSVKFPKFKKGDATVCKILNEATYGYVNELLDCLLAFHRERALPASVRRENSPPPLSTSYIRPNKGEAIERHQTRFSTT